LSHFASTAFDEPLSEIARLVPDARKAGEIRAQHLLRIAVKHWRYRIEILSFLMGAAYGEIHGAVKGYQEVLGKMHDLDVFSGIVGEAELSSPARTNMLDIIKLKKESFFTVFSTMLENIPLEKIGEQIEKAL
jgi:CHAD domain-containing protein